VTIAVQFYDQASRELDKVNDVATNRSLLSEMKAKWL